MTRSKILQAKTIIKWLLKINFKNMKDSSNTCCRDFFLDFLTQYWFCTMKTFPFADLLVGLLELCGPYVKYSLMPLRICSDLLSKTSLQGVIIQQNAVWKYLHQNNCVNLQTVISHHMTWNWHHLNVFS